MFRVIKPELQLECDLCPRRETYRGDTVREIRFDARENGWRMIVTGKCYCSDCWKKLGDENRKARAKP